MVNGEIDGEETIETTMAPEELDDFKMEWDTKWDTSRVSYCCCLEIHDNKANQIEEMKYETSDTKSNVQTFSTIKILKSLLLDPS